ncbi:MAG: molybdopterin synthase catalytic subunit [Frankiales bacterium]|nr:molybdopterin synthase catalytic subunit [Frankiales bacterium]
MSSPPVSGAVAISGEPIDVSAVLASVVSSARGGTVLFTGQVRDHDEGKGVRELEYVAHPTAVRQLEEVVAQVAQEFPEVGLAAVHRVGLLTVGDVAVAVAAGAAHRDDAFRAARLLIDRVKDEVPIWKRQRFLDGGEEWVGSPSP